MLFARILELGDGDGHDGRGAMRNMSTKRAEFLDVLVGIAKGHSTTDDLSRRLQLAIKRFGSETPDNISYADVIEVGRVDEEAGLKFRGRPLLFSEIAHLLEDSTMPASVRSACPTSPNVSGLPSRD